MSPRTASRLRAGIIAARSRQPWAHMRANWPRQTWEAYRRARGVR